MMKKTILAMILMFGFQMSQAQTVNNIFSEFQDEAGAVCVKVPWLPIKLIGLFADDEDKAIIQRINSIRVLELSDCTDKVQERFAARMRTLKMDDYESLLTMKDDGNNVRMWGRMEGDDIRELVIGVSGDGDALLCCIKGQLSMDDINISMSDNTVKLVSDK